ncbi:uncharacterized protein LOC126379275 isoform X1 [Pectinophora gossypiella]|uniref:uncharacterized protein LOC126379275 isoform X1 n=1 Tax=Pectinophora gossypiella TaxID=13191 RepID=UPI00214ED654|nr:uncharacterized protein LOC126379275 isoform X1 [Pectinophora gossypiella]
MYFSSKFKKRRFYADYYMGFFNISDYDYSNNTGSGNPAKKIRDYNWTFGVKQRNTHPQVIYPHFCMFPGQYKRKLPWGAKGADRKPIHNAYTPEPGKWYINWRQAMFMLCFELMTLFTALFLIHHIDPQSESVTVTKELEDTLKQFHVGREPGRDTDYVQPPPDQKPKQH